jgi:hypothetical protein
MQSGAVSSFFPVSLTVAIPVSSAVATEDGVTAFHHRISPAAWLPGVRPEPFSQAKSVHHLIIHGGSIMTHPASSFRGFGLALASGVLLLGAMSPSFAADAAKEIATATDHAGYAAQATVLKTTYTHLHHVINCLVGPSDANFDAKEANPCAAMGSGAIPDTSDAATKMALSSAVTKAKAGLDATDLDAAKSDALTVQEMLKQVK